MGRKVSTGAAAKLASVTDRTIRNWCEAGLPHRRTAGGHIRIDVDDLTAFLAPPDVSREANPEMPGVEKSEKPEAAA